MPHGAIIGMTTSGKTTLAMQFARDFRKLDIPTLVLHKPREAWSEECASWQTSDPEKFLAKFASCQGHACFMELADGSVDKYDSRFHKCFTEGRHDGHRCYYLSQRAATVHPAIRENCIQLCLFTVTSSAAKIWAEEFNDLGLMQAVDLPPYVFLHKENRYSPLVKRKLNLPKKK